MNRHNVMKKKYALKNDYLALDFDGVIADSIEECLVVGFNAYNEFSGEGNRILDLSDLPNEDITGAKRLRNFIRSGEDYVYIQLALSECVEILNQEDFDDFLLNNSRLKHTFFKLFYEERERLSTEHAERWIQLNPLYPGMHEFLRRYPDRERLFIISTKKKHFINRILTGHEIDFPGKNIFHAGQDRSKNDIIQDLMEMHTLSPSHFRYVDDQVDTLIKMKYTGVKRYLAGWGYNDDKQKARARDANIPVLTLDDFYELTKG